MHSAAPKVNPIKLCIEKLRIQVAYKSGYASAVKSALCSPPSRPGIICLLQAPYQYLPSRPNPLDRPPPSLSHPLFFSFPSYD